MFNKHTLHYYAFSSQIFYDILSCLINCNYPQIIEVKSLIIIKYLFKELLINKNVSQLFIFFFLCYSFESLKKKYLN